MKQAVSVMYPYTAKRKLALGNTSPSDREISREDVFPIVAPGSESSNAVPRAVFPNTLPREQGVNWII